MTTELKAYDMGRFQRIVGNEGTRVSGMWRVLSLKREGEDEHLVLPLDVTIWMGADGDEHRWGQGVRAEDFSADVVDGVVQLDPDRISDKNKRAAVLDHLEQMRETILAVARAARYQEADPE
jgi:hypothetical protein